MLRLPTITKRSCNLMAQADLPPPVLFGETEVDLWPYRSRTMALLRRCARASVEVGRLPSLLGEFFRSRVTSYSTRNLEDTMVFVADMEHTLEELDALDKKLVAMSALEEYTISEISRTIGRSERTVERLFLSKSLLVRGLLERLPEVADKVSVKTQTQ
jgi:DNA-directed RNA polymerase specialized sigma24 family protein